MGGSIEAEKNILFIPQSLFFVKILNLTREDIAPRERISGMLLVATANRTVVDNLATRVYTASSRTGVFALLVYTRLVAWAF